MSRSGFLGCVLTALVMLAQACHPAPPTSAAGQAAAGSRESLAELAEQVAHGAPPLRPLFPALPQEMQDEIKKRVGAIEPGEKTFEQAKVRLTKFDIRLGAPETAVPVVEGLYLAESLVFGPPGPMQLNAAALLASFYENVPVLFGSFAKVRTTFGNLVGVQAPEGPFASLWRVVLRESPGQQAALAALVMRGNPGQDTLTVVLTSRARSLGHERLELRRKLQQEAIARSGAAATASQWLDLADTYLLAGDPIKAKEAIDQSAGARVAVEGLSPEEQRQVASTIDKRRVRLKESQQRLVEVRSLDSATSPEQRLRRAALLTANRDLVTARDAYEQLRKDLPGDARPVVGLVRVELSKTEDFFDRIFELKGMLQAGAALDHRDGDYYGLMIALAGVETAKLLREAASSEQNFKSRLVGVLDELISLNDENKRFAPERAAILEFVLKTARNELGGQPRPGTIQERLTSYCVEAVALAARYPTTPDAYRLTLSCASALDEANAFPIVDSSPPDALAQDPAIAALRARVLVGLIAKHRAYARLPAARRLVDALPGREENQKGIHQLLVADISLLSTMDRRTPWAETLSAYEKARELDPLHENDRLSNNLGVALLAQNGPPQQAVDRFKEAMARSDSNLIARSNLSGIALQFGTADDARALLEPILKADPPPLIGRLHLAQLGRDTKDTKMAQEQAAAALKEVKTEGDEKYPPLNSELSFDPKGTFTVSLGVKSGEPTYALEISSYYEPYLLLPSKLRYADLVALAKGKSEEQGKGKDKAPRPKDKPKK